MSSSGANLGLTFDQNQLIQISHLMGDMNNQQQPSFGDQPALASFQINAQSNPSGANAFNGEQQQQFYLATEATNAGSSIQASAHISPSSLLKQQQQQQFMSQTSGGTAESNQVHTIILNGQPALFIPASAAMSSSLLCQMMMGNNNAGQQAGNTVVDLGSVNNNTTTNNNNSAQQYEYIQLPAADHNSGSSQLTSNQQQFINVDQLFNGAYLTAGDLGQSIVLNAQSQTCSNSQMAFIQLPTTPAKAGDQNQQIICLSNGELVSTFQPFVSSSQEAQADKPEVRTPSKIRPAPEGGRTTPLVKTTPKKTKGPTVASVLASSNNHHNNISYLCANNIIYAAASSIQNLSPAKCHDKDVVVRSHKDIAMAMDTGADEPIQLIFLNTTNMASPPQLTVTDTPKKPEETAKQPEPSVREPDQKASASSFSSSKDDKKRRKACDCPNCIRWRSNMMTEEELKKRRTHKCHKCVKEYNKTSHLRAHLRAHDGYRPFVCEFKGCDKSFTRSDELKRHRRIHNDDRNYSCPVCNKKFLRSDHLNKHVLVHGKVGQQAEAVLTNQSSSSPPASPLSSESGSASSSESMIEESPGRPAPSTKLPVKA